MNKLRRGVLNAYMLIGILVWAGSFLPWVPVWVTMLGAATFAVGWWHWSKTQ